MEIVNHKTGHRADISFKKSNMFSKEVHKIEGCIVDSRNVKLLMLYGSWTDAIFSVLPQQWELHVKPDKQKSGPNLDVMKSFRKSLVKSKDDDQEIPKRASDFDLKIPGQTFLWQADDRSPNSDKYYSFTKFAMMLNELNSDASQLCPTDCRLRPDIRCLELGNIDEAAEKKVYLEEKQRGARKEMKKNKEEWSPKWFSLDIHPVTKKSDWLFNHRYLKRDWAASPDIF
ncbi:OSBPL1A [Bugula neritina]|uniref:OSBPL1A n=1 Tax=Bugula neritina TaxID=10212 RepID=A0A7J7J872_BUGNE|nr:OSBPL1A [Bugula neritina]